MEDLHFIELQLLSDRKRIKITSLLFSNDSIIIPYNSKIHPQFVDAALEILKAGKFKIKGYGHFFKNQTAYRLIVATTTFDIIKPLKNLYATLGENPFKSLKVTAQKPTNQKPLKKYKRCI